MDTSIIIAASALGGSAIGAIGAALACRPWQDWTIKRINKDRADLRDANNRLRDQRVSWFRKSKELYRALATENRARLRAEAQLALAGKPDQPRDPITGRWLSKEAA